MLTVERGLETLSNGTLISSTDNTDGTKTDYWKQDQPHAPYLFMVAVGDFARVTDSWKGKPLEYMVDPPYEADAKKIFDHTPEMLTFFSDLLDYPYPWDKYSQVVVEDFVSGAMENTTAVTFGDFVQKTSRELIDDGNDKIVAHEMFHHWFGDLVTCESWANLTLNEGFANYSEYLWYEHKYGKDAADHHRAEEMNTYLFMVNQTGTHPLIHYGYGDREEMFDVHSYNKGGLVLHMLRNHIGDEAFFAALHKYLHDNKYTAVEVDELRMAFEDVTGADLNWFFDQWYLDEGHPVINSSYSYDSLAKSIKIKAEQLQEPSAHRPVFILPMEVAVIDADGKLSYHPVTLDSRYDSVTITNINSAPAAVILDGMAYTLAEINQEYTEDELVNIIKYSTQWTHKMMAAKKLTGSPRYTEVVKNLTKEKHYSLRLKGLEGATEVDHFRMARDMAFMDKHSQVRAKALEKYAENYRDQAGIIAKSVLQKNTEAYPVMKTALNILYEEDKTAAIGYAEQLATDNSVSLVNVLSELLAETGDGKYLPYFEKNLDRVSVYQVFNVYGAYSNLLLKQDENTMYNSATKLKPIALNGDNMYKRFMATSTLNDVKNKLKQLKVSQPTELTSERITTMEKTIAEIKNAETDEGLKSRYNSLD